MTSTQITKEVLETLSKWINDAKYILIGAGAGMSVDAGIDYTSEDYMKKHYPVLYEKYDCKTAYHTIGKHDWPTDVSWAYLIQHINRMRFEIKQVPVYQSLKKAINYDNDNNDIGKKDVFVVTSNVDGMFEKNGFDNENIYTPQGDFQYYQCLKPCSRTVWPIKPIIDNVLPAIDKANTVITKKELIPKCPKCGYDVMGNVRGGDWFIHDHFDKYEQRLMGWFQQLKQKSDLNQLNDGDVLIFDIGSGFNTPSVIRWRCEKMACYIKEAKFVRINLHYPDVTEQLKQRSLALPLSALDLFEAVCAYQLSQTI